MQLSQAQISCPFIRACGNAASPAQQQAAPAHGSCLHCMAALAGRQAGNHVSACQCAWQLEYRSLDDFDVSRTLLLVIITRS
jgi:hypothetical protein